MIRAIETPAKANSPDIEMKRVCVIDIAGLSRRLVEGRPGLWVGSLEPAAGGFMRPTLPAVTASVQASMTTGRYPGEHGVVAGGVFRRQSRSYSFAERSNTLLSKKRFWHARDLPGNLTVALAFWSNPLAGGGDIVLGAATYSCDHGEVSNQPAGLYQQIAEKCGEFDCHTLTGPRRSHKAASWIAQAATEIWRSCTPDLMWVYLPGVDFELVRGSVDDNPSAQEALAEVDARAHELAEVVCGDGGEAVVVSDGGYSNVKQAACPNVRLKDAGLLVTRDTDQGERIDLDASRAMALVDHQFAHLYCVDERAADEAVSAVADLEGVDAVLPRSEVFHCGLGHDRAGERVMIARPDAWFAYRWWGAGAEPPAWAYQVASDRKCGYDPCELFAGGQADSIDPDESAVRASRGRSDVPQSDCCFLASTCPLPAPDEMCVTDLPGVLRQVMFD